MKNYFHSIKGMHDYLPSDVFIWNYIKKIFSEILNSYCFNEIKIPILEETRLFQQAIGKDTDVIKNEMYSFLDKKCKSLTLRPEGTVGCVRLIIEHFLLHQTKKQKLWYCGEMFRYEKPQKGRFRQFYQIGAEVFGLENTAIELELILLIQKIWKILGVSQYLVLEINSIGSIQDRLLYEKFLVDFLNKHINNLDKYSLFHLKNKPLGILDSKNIQVQEILSKAPILNQYLNQKSNEKFKKFCKLLNIMNVKYTINNYLVRGLDYYNDIVFEWKSSAIGSQSTICAGGRYDKLMKKIGGPDTPAVGFAVGMERLILLLKILKKTPNFSNYIDIEIFFLEKSLKIEAIKLAEEIRNKFNMLKIQIDFFNNSIIKKFRCANKLNVNVVLLIGKKEFSEGNVTIKILKTHHQECILRTRILEKLYFIFKDKIQTTM
ncbi:histidine--tRNA ligase [Buchnera aphidicola (Hormaphis cornu)]|nr:histidine--tRNA ligase [Buchnera aphidicola (Hormaphis cornu)]